MTITLARFATAIPQTLLAVTIVLADTFLIALVIVVRGTAPEQRPAVLRAFAQVLPVRRR
ncbi:hypothetical protein RCO28_18710 [Streptomyces sp. LHD-70]|uniref:hypothetical protein n=1 Tax=Streptomyces sp. LHD-70 TaxID=3072140 RepID=UPI0028106E95|nr:hypothetical protein [Streptomyces sp. LHD-70]MDQ8704504.1 hypothetical protein [Streptomyces sp. LHD-70]